MAAKLDPTRVRRSEQVGASWGQRAGSGPSEWHFSTNFARPSGRPLVLADRRRRTWHFRDFIPLFSSSPRPAHGSQLALPPHGTLWGRRKWAWSRRVGRATSGLWLARARRFAFLQLLAGAAEGGRHLAPARDIWRWGPQPVRALAERPRRPPAGQQLLRLFPFHNHLFVAGEHGDRQSGRQEGE